MLQPRLVPNLWFDTNAEEAAEFYVSVFQNSRIVSKANYTDAGPRPADLVMTVEFELDGTRFVAINGGPEFTFDEAVLIPDQLRDARGDRLLLGPAQRGRGGRPLRLAEGPLRAVLAGRPPRDGRAVRRPGHVAGDARDDGDARDAQARHRRAAARC